MSLVIEDEQDEQESGGSGALLLGLLIVAGAVCAAMMGNPVGTSTTAAPINTTGSVVDVSSLNQRYVSLARQDALQVGIDPRLFVNQIYKESSFRIDAVSPAGAVGIAQFLPETASERGVDPYDPESALKGAADWMAELDHQYGSYDAALAAYNSGPGTVDAAMKNCGPSWESCLPTETKNYIAAIEQ